MSLAERIFVPTYTRKTKPMSVKVFLTLFTVAFLLSLLFNFILQSLALVAPSVNRDMGVGFWGTILLAVIMVPLIEESCFRLWLKRGKNNFAYSMISATFLLLSCGFLISAPWYIFTLVLLTSVVLFITILVSRLRPRVFIRNYSTFYYISIITFGLAHLGNFSPSQLVSPYILPLIAIPFIIAGLILGYTRISYGFKYSYLLHATLNLSLLLLW